MVGVFTHTFAWKNKNVGKVVRLRQTLGLKGEKYMSMYKKVDTSLNFVEREKEVVEYWN